MSLPKRKQDRQVLDLRVPFTTLLKITFFIGLLIALQILWPVLILVIISALLAVVLDPVLVWLAHRRVRRGFGVALIAILLFGAVFGFIGAVLPSVAGQLTQITTSIPKALEGMAESTPMLRPFVRSILSSMHKGPTSPQIHSWMSQGLVVGKYALQGLTGLFLCLVLALYLLLEGNTLLAWLVSFSPQALRQQMSDTIDQSREVFIAYMRGQFITCVVCGVYCYIVLFALGVPAALALAVLAFVADLVPVIGTIVMTIPAVLLALTVSPGAALGVVAAYFFYHLAESYWLIPIVYGRSMRLSTLTVLLAVTIGGTLLGVVGAVLALPLAAVYPIIERIWLREHLAEGTVEEHEALESDDAAESKQAAKEVLMQPGSVSAATSESSSS